MNWWNWLPGWAQRFLAKVPSPVVEFFSAIIAVALGVLTAYALAALPPSRIDHVRTLGGYIVTTVFATMWSLLYEIMFDPRKRDPTHDEKSDLGWRQLGIFVWIWVWTLI